MPKPNLSPQKPTNNRQRVIAYRKSCVTNGTGLSHFVIMDSQDRPST